MNNKELNFILQKGEGYNLEFKEKHSDSIAKEICACQKPPVTELWHVAERNTVSWFLSMLRNFSYPKSELAFSHQLQTGGKFLTFANANGGKILLGIADNGEIKGVKATNKLKSQICDVARNFDPKLEVSLEEIDNVLIINVPEGIDKPYSVNGKFYLRHGPNSQQLSRDEIREFFQKEGLVQFDEKLNYDFDLKRDFDDFKFRNFLKKARISPILKKREILENLSLVKDGRLKNTGVLLFCRRITKFFPNATITCVLYQGKTKYKILDRKEFDADLYSNFQDAFVYLQSKLNTEFIIKGGPREERLELPEEALREALLNAIAHRSYFVSGANILVDIFSDRIEITNPGGLVKGITKKDLGKKSLSRNNLLFGLMQRMNLVEKVGSGILRMKQAMKRYSLSLKFEISENWFTAVFERSRKALTETTQKTTQKTIETVNAWLTNVDARLTQELSDKEKEILLFVFKTERINSADCQKLFNISREMANRYFTRLIERNLIVKKGAGKYTYYVISSKRGETK